jgi:peptidoglycan/LPS O-acetylase OafA/YrhL
MSVWPIPINFAIVILSAWLLSLYFPAPSKSGRFIVLDGLRGYLAIGVFVHHGAVWYFYLRSSFWSDPPSRVYINLGHVSVELFFMITGFLFWSKILKARPEPVNWFRLYVSRFLRLFPLYFFMFVLLAMTVGLVTHFQLREPLHVLCLQSLKWLSFMVNTLPELNQCEGLNAIASMVWTLAYEWLFYLALPLLSVLVGVASPRVLVFSSLYLAIILLFGMQPDLMFLLPFGSGMTTAFLVHRNLIPGSLKGNSGSILAVLLLIFVVVRCPDAFMYLPIILLTVVFSIIAGGNTIFGLLEWRVSRFLGEFTYSIYLLHGLMLFWLFHFIIGPRAASLSPAAHWLYVTLCIPLLILICFITYRWIELPAMQNVPKVTDWFYKSQQRLKSRMVARGRKS